MSSNVPSDSKAQESLGAWPEAKSHLYCVPRAQCKLQRSNHEKHFPSLPCSHKVGMEASPEQRCEVQCAKSLLRKLHLPDRRQEGETVLFLLFLQKLSWDNDSVRALMPVILAKNLLGLPAVKWIKSKLLSSVLGCTHDLVHIREHYFQAASLFLYLEALYCTLFDPTLCQISW